MSKITDALNKAEADRRAATPQDAASAGYFRALKQELWEEVRGLEEAFSRRGATAPAKPQPPAAPSALAEAPPPPAPATNVSAPREAAPAAPETWDQRLQQAQQQLLLVEQEMARKLAEQATLQAKLDTCEQRLVDVKQEQAALRERLTAVRDAAASIESARLSWTRQVDALRECQGLAQEARAAEQELQAQAAVTVQTTHSYQELGQELARHREREQALQKRLEQVRFRLGQALASTGSISSDSGD